MTSANTTGPSTRWRSTSHAVAETSAPITWNPLSSSLETILPRPGVQYCPAGSRRQKQL
jgi:hypothetical protein